MRFTYFAFALALLTVSVAAQNKKNVLAQSSTSVLINGQPIKGKVLEIDGKHFVAVEDLTQSLRGTIAYGDGQIALTLSELPPVTALLLKTATFHVWSLFFPYGTGLQLSRFVCARARAHCTIAARISWQSSGALPVQ